MKDEMNASEAVYGFAAWLTTRKEVTTMGANNDCALVAELVAEFIKVNELPKVRDGWEENLTHPADTGGE